MGKSTGLMGGNPYRKSKLNLDIGGAATKVLLDQATKDEARGEAMDKYFKDWEKQINPAGLGDKELYVFNKMLADAQDYGIKNKENIRKPSRDGYEANSTLMSKYKNMQAYIDGAKQKTAKVKAFKDEIDRYRASGKKISANVLDVINSADQAYGTPEYKEPSFANIKVFDQFDPKKFFDNSLHKVQLEEKEESQPIIDNGKNTGFDLKTTKIVAPVQALQKIGNNAYDDFANDYGVQDHFEELFKDKTLVDKLNPLFGQVYAHQDANTAQMINPKIQSASDLARAVAIANQEKETIKKTENVMNDEGKFKDWYRKHKITAAANAANTNALLKAIALQGSQKLFNNTLANYTTNEVIGPNKNLNKLNLPVTYTNAYKNSIEIPKTIADEALMNQGLSYETKKIELTPIFGRDPSTGTIILAYPKVKSNGALTGEYDWSKGQDVTNDLSNSIVDKAVGSQRTVDVISGGTPKKEPKNKLK
jgi:hypothetical protein